MKEFISKEKITVNAKQKILFMVLQAKYLRLGNKKIC
jgi:hypothetical protein